MNGPPPMPKSFYDLQLKRPKNQSVSAIPKDLFDDWTNIDKNQFEEKIMNHQKNKKEEELRRLQELLHKNDQDGADSMGEISVHKGPQNRRDQGDLYARHVQTRRGGPAENYSKVDDPIPEQSRTQAGDHEANHPVSKPTAAFLQNDRSRPSLSPEENMNMSSLLQPPGHVQRLPDHQLQHSHVSRRRLNVPGPVNPNQFIHQYEPKIQNEKMNYDPHDNDLNRRANKEFNNLNHIQFLGAGRPVYDPDMDRLRDVQRNQVNKLMLEEQIREMKIKKEIEKQNRKRADEMEDERIRRENEEMDRKERMEKEKDKDKKMRLQMEK